MAQNTYIELYFLFAKCNFTLTVSSQKNTPANLCKIVKLKVSCINCSVIRVGSRSSITDVRDTIKSEVVTPADNCTQF